MYMMDQGYCNKLIDFLESLLDKFDGVVRGIGPILISLAFVLISSAALFFFYSVLPFYFSEYEKPLSFPLILNYAFHGIIGLWFCVVIFFNYFNAVATSPGHPKESNQRNPSNANGYHDGTSSALVAEENVSIAVQIEPQGSRHSDSEEDESENKSCQKCNRLKPERTHHCTICTKCVYKMDHHCNSYSAHSDFLRSMGE